MKGSATSAPAERECDAGSGLALTRFDVMDYLTDEAAVTEYLVAVAELDHPVLSAAALFDAARARASWGLRPETGEQDR
jgi:hypothetical protein